MLTNTARSRIFLTLNSNIFAGAQVSWIHRLKKCQKILWHCHFKVSSKLFHSNIDYEDNTDLDIPVGISGFWENFQFPTSKDMGLCYCPVPCLGGGGGVGGGGWHELVAEVYDVWIPFPRHENNMQFLPGIRPSLYAVGWLADKGRLTASHNSKRKANIFAVCYLLFWEMIRIKIKMFYWRFSNLLITNNMKFLIIKKTIFKIGVVNFMKWSAV